MIKNDAHAKKTIMEKRSVIFGNKCSIITISDGLLVGVLNFSKCKRVLCDTWHHRRQGTLFFLIKMGRVTDPAI